jgi:hypothetical protein
MVIITAAVLMLSGLFCLWLSFEYLNRMDNQRLAREGPAPKKEEADPEEEKPRLTRLGRPIEEVRLRA